MRKTSLIILSIASAFAMSACSSGNNSNKPTTATAASTQAPTEKETVKPTESESEPTEVETTVPESTSENAVNSDSESNSESVSSDTTQPQLDTQLSEILDKIYEIKKPEFAFDSMAVDFDDEYAVSSYTGLTMDDAEKLDAAIVSEPMMSSQAYSLVLVRVKDKVDAADIAQKMADGINQRKWVCVEADDLTVVSKDDIIMLFMADKELSFSSDDAVAAFTEAYGKPDKTYQKK